MMLFLWILVTFNPTQVSVLPLQGKITEWLDDKMRLADTEKNSSMVPG